MKEKQFGCVTAVAGSALMRPRGDGMAVKIQPVRQPFNRETLDRPEEVGAFLSGDGGGFDYLPEHAADLADALEWLAGQVRNATTETTNGVLIHAALPTAVDPARLRALEKAEQELRNIVKAKRFDRDVFSDDAEFGDWVVSRAGHTLSALAALPPVEDPE